MMDEPIERQIKRQQDAVLGASEGFRCDRSEYDRGFGPGVGFGPGGLMYGPVAPSGRQDGPIASMEAKLDRIIAALGELQAAIAKR